MIFRSISLLLFMAISYASFAQLPAGFTYQAVARDANGICLSDTLLTVQILINDSSSLLYEEQHANVPTNDQGMFSIVIGDGVKQGSTGEYDEIDWNMRSSDFNMTVRISPENNNTLIDVGNVSLNAVPFAAAANNGKIMSETNGDEFIRFFGTNGSNNVTIGGLPGTGGAYNHGAINIWNEDNEQAIEAWSSQSAGGAGWMHIYGENGLRNIEFSMLSAVDHPNFGAIRMRDDMDAAKVYFRVFSNRVGIGTFYGANGSRNIEFGTGGSNVNQGGISVRDDVSTAQASMYIDTNGDGVLAADLKPFFMDHPDDSTKEIWYCAVEGPEAAAYDRGTAQLVNGEAYIPFSEHFSIVADEQSMTIMLTPWSAESEGMAVVERTATGFVVKELHGGTGTYQFDWEVKAKRKGFEDWEVIRDKVELVQSWEESTR